MKRQLPKIVVVLGPTATGKSDLAVDIAKRWKGEVISADSRQVYKGMDVGSGKITKKEMKGVRHHLLDVIDPKNPFNVEKFKLAGNKAIKDILSGDKLPIICGGTGFYIDALVFDERFPDVEPDRKLRARLEKRSAKALMKMIRKLDPERARNLDPNNKVRIIRAIEIARTLGKVPKVKRKKRYDALFIGLTLPREKLRERVHKRLLNRMDEGMTKEISKLHRSGVSWKRLHSFGLEYRHLALYLQKKISKDEMLESLERDIMRFAKRQMTWFRRNKNIKWFSPGQNKKILGYIKKFL